MALLDDTFCSHIISTREHAVRNQKSGSKGIVAEFISRNPNTRKRKTLWATERTKIVLRSPEQQSRRRNAKLVAEDPEPGVNFIFRNTATTFHGISRNPIFRSSAKSQKGKAPSVALLCTHTRTTTRNIGVNRSNSKRALALALFLACGKL